MWKWLIRVYQDAIPDHSRLFKDPKNPSDLLDAKPLLTLIYKILIKEMIVPLLEKTDDKTHVANLIHKAPIHVHVPGGRIQDRRLNRNGLRVAMEHSRAEKIPTIEILINTGLFHVTTNDFLYANDWSKLTMDPAKAAPRTADPATTPAPVPASAIAPPVQASMYNYSSAMRNEEESRDPKRAKREHDQRKPATQVRAERKMKQERLAAEAASRRDGSNLPTAMCKYEPNVTQLNQPVSRRSNTMKVGIKAFCCRRYCAPISCTIITRQHASRLLRLFLIADLCQNDDG